MAAPTCARLPGNVPSCGKSREKMRRSQHPGQTGMHRAASGIRGG
eukprot:CAMPEP_0197906832 /NCGR_PEP_ID=MMETSP1439-20131203/63554_1 /TAXON_ID=66791 /ORGANISM="Gonyaulax spinifera, Strain CCMP409" /LENGTH=44 /DNA_ID= /DNA_START= /DNA_END= /DNA_ORIENTATION=